MIFGTILGVKAFIYKFVEKVRKSKNRLAVWVDNNINHTLMTLVFYLTFQDEILIVFMQFNDIRLDTGIDVFSFILALVALVHMIVMLGYIMYFILKDMSNEDRARKCGAFFAGLKDSDPAKNLHVNARLVSLVVFSKMIQKAILVIVIVYAKTANEILPLLILCCFVLMGELTIQPYKSIIVFIVTFVLSLFQFLLICMVYLIKDAETKDQETLNTRNDALGGLLVTFVVVKYLVIFGDLIFAAITIIRAAMDKPKKNKVEEELAKGQQIHNQDTEGDEVAKNGRIPVFDSVNSIKKNSGDLNGSGDKLEENESQDVYQASR
jgi:hypothetical protein